MAQFTIDSLKGQVGGERPKHYPPAPPPIVRDYKRLGKEILLFPQGQIEVDKLVTH